ncbi:TPA: hypothetical protein EYO12_01345 [Candidatus Saccharibacteria bacterium]|nr:hypothetical protein [Candidatus Saccharibacteria bacterium]HIO87364.1 hypothetical protein [Candidatus Saccharibacteria bacterium]
MKYLKLYILQFLGVVCVYFADKDIVLFFSILIIILTSLFELWLALSSTTTNSRTVSNQGSFTAKILFYSSLSLGIFAVLHIFSSEAAHVEIALPIGGFCFLLAASVFEMMYRVSKSTATTNKYVYILYVIILPALIFTLLRSVSSNLALVGFYVSRDIFLLRTARSLVV